MRIGEITTTTLQRGSLGGLVGSVARGGIQYYRKRSLPSNPRTYLQTVVRAILSGVAAAWRNTLDNTQRAGWTAIAKTGESGIDRYTAANVPIMQSGTARVDAAPASADNAWAAIPISSEFVIALGTNTASLNNAGTHYGANGEKINFYLQSQVQPDSRLFPVGNPEYVGTATIAGTVHPSISIADFIATHPDYDATLKASMGVLKFATTGEVSQRIEALVTIS